MGAYTAAIFEKWVIFITANLDVNFPFFLATPLFFYLLLNFEIKKIIPHFEINIKLIIKQGQKVVHKNVS